MLINLNDLCKQIDRSIYSLFHSFLSLLNHLNYFHRNSNAWKFHMTGGQFFVTHYEEIVIYACFKEPKS